MAIELPDFDDMQTMIDTIYRFNYEKSRLDIEIKKSEAEIIKTVTTNPTYFSGGKPLSMAQIESTYKYTGLNDELIALRYAMATAVAELEKARLTFQLAQSKLEIWRSQVANERASLI